MIWRSNARTMSTQIHARLWDEAKGFYVDRDMDGHFSNVLAVSGFLPLLLDDIPAAHTQRLVNWLNHPQAFTAPFPVPSVALNDPEWSTDLWRGATWINYNYLVYLGLAKQGYTDLAARLRSKTLEMVNKYYQRYGVLFEFFDARDIVPPVACDRKGPRVEPYDIRRKMDSIRDYHWTAALTAAMLFSPSNSTEV
jgi:neutral trehalase